MHTSHTVKIESIDLEAKGVTHIDNKTTFVYGALPNEEVAIKITKSKPSFNFASLEKIITPSALRVIPKCPNYNICGGCSFQHLEINAQINYKQAVLIENLQHIAKITPSTILPPIVGIPWGYRFKARLSARFLINKDIALVGFREKHSSYVTNMSSCEVLPQEVSNLIPKLKSLIAQLSIRDKIPQIEVAVGEEVIVLVFRIMQTLSIIDEMEIKKFTDNENNIASKKTLQIWLQPKDINSAKPFYPLNAPKLFYTLKDYSITMPFYPTEFTQINPLINQKMVKLAIELLDPKQNEKIIDFFCGIGNFTLPIAKFSEHVIGVEGSMQLVARAKENATINQLKPEFLVTDLFSINEDWLSNLGQYDKWLIDPPRDGAITLIKAINAINKPKKIIYISCNPATLARDAGILVNVKGYKLNTCGVINMFPHTSHVESIAEFIL